MYQSSSSKDLPGALGVALQHRGRAQKALRSRKTRHHRDSDVVGPLVVDVEQPEIGERIAQGGHLPVDHGRDRAEVSAVQHVGKPVVTVHDAVLGLAGMLCSSRSTTASSRSSPPGTEAWNCLCQRATCRPRNPSGRPKFCESDRGRFDLMQRDQGVDQQFGGPAGGGGVRHQLGSLDDRSRRRRTSDRTADRARCCQRTARSAPEPARRCHAAPRSR